MNFGLAVDPLELDRTEIRALNAAFLSRLAWDRNPLPRTVRLPAIESLPTASVVPGSEVVTGPDMTSGAPGDARQI